MTCIPGHRALLITFLLAAGCGEMAYEDFVIEKVEIEDEIRSVCTGEDLPSYGAGSDAFLGKCAWFLPLRGQRCLDAMDEALESAYYNVRTCEAWQASDNPLPECDEDEVTRRRRGLSCFVERLSGGGRPIRERGVPVTAPIITDGPGPEPTSPRQRAALGWFEVARYEHASIATFSYAAVELMSLGAPLELVRRCHDAALDEARHAEAALGIATRLHGSRLRFGPLPPVAFEPRTLRAVAVDALIEGCWGEGSAAVVAGVGASRAEPKIADVLHIIAREETRHAELAWATVKWAVQQQPSLLAELARELHLHHRTRVGRATRSELDLHEYGLLGRSEIEALELEVLERIVAPVLGAMARSPDATGTAGPPAAARLAAML